MPVDKNKVDSAGCPGEPEAPDSLAEAMPGTAYGCCFCVTGKERMVAEHIRRALPQVRTMVARQEKHRTANGKKWKEEELILPGYIFFEAPADIVPSQCFPRESVIRVLATDEGLWQLAGDDWRFVHWLFAYDGLLGFSKAYREGEKIRIISGPLKDMEGRITRIDKRGCSGQVTLEFSGRRIPVWLGFDLIQSRGEQ